MGIPRVQSSIVALLGSAVLCTVAAPALACGGFDESARVRTTTETAIIVYDATTKEERFIRRASFATNAGHDSEIGFIVPTPTRPTLEEVDNEVFRTLDNGLQAHLDSIAPSGGSSNGGGGCGSSDSNDFTGGAPTRGGVEVVEETRIAGQDATVLLASDPQALTSWLDAHGFRLEASMRNYFDGYVEKGWYLTAFRYRPTAADQRLDIKAVSMRFQTERAFYPYREAPSESTGEGRSLRVYTLASAPQAADLGLAGEAWNAGRLVWSERLSPALQQQLAPLGALPRDVVVTGYDDFSNPRDGKDELWFYEKPSLLESTPTPLSGALGSPLALLAAAALVRRALVKARSKQPSRT